MTRGWKIAFLALLAIGLLWLAYYLRMIVALWAATNKEPALAPTPVLARWSLGAAAIAVLALIAMPGQLTKGGAAQAQAAPTAQAQPVLPAQPVAR